MAGVFDGGVGSREEQGFVPAVPPADQIRRCTVLTVDLYDLTVAVHITDSVTPDDDVVANARLHLRLLSSFIDASGVLPR
jgi:hypothetical protein